MEETVVEEVKPQIENIIEEVKPKIEESINAVDKSVDKVCDELEDAADKAQTALEKLVESKPEVEKLVDVVDEILAGRSCGCLLFGWKVSVEKIGRTLKKSPSTA